MAILTDTGRIALAKSIKESKLYLAWGIGADGWETNPPRESRSQSALTHEIGRRLVNEVSFCAADEDGDIEMLGAKFRKTAMPTSNLYLRTEFDFNDGFGQTIRELGVFFGVNPRSTLPAGQRYFSPDDLEDRGILLALDHISPLSRGVGARVSFDFVLCF